MENKDNPYLTVVIATFNSSKLLPRTLDALVNQTYPRKRMEILIVDGGSTDDTLSIAKDYGCIVINNPETEPAHAKVLGIMHASGKYMIVLDHDEVLINRDSVRKRVELLEKHPSCKVAFCSGYKRPDDYPLLNEYISEFGDPFSLFMYNFSKGAGFQEKGLRRICNIISEENEYLYVSFEKTKRLPIIEPCCLATIINIEWFKTVIDLEKNPQDAAHLFYIMLSNGFFEVIMLKNDPLEHYSADSFRAYFPKLKWRIKNNVHFADHGAMGFKGRQKYAAYTKNKRYLFVPYTVLIPVPIIHSFYLAITRKNPVFLIHPILCWYVLVNIVVEYTKKLLGKTPTFTSYDGKKVIK